MNRMKNDNKIRHRGRRCRQTGTFSISYELGKTTPTHIYMKTIEILSHLFCVGSSNTNKFESTHHVCCRVMSHEENNI